MNKPHKHAELIKAWADGAEIEWVGATYNDGRKHWTDCKNPVWDEESEYRIKLEPRPDYVIRALAVYGREIVYEGCLIKDWIIGRQPNLKLVYDGETKELKSAEVLR